MKLIKLTKGLYSMVDDIDYDYLMGFKWQARHIKRKIVPETYYAKGHIARIHGKNIHSYMHILILDRICGENTDPEIVSDHINHNGLDNRRKNLRRVSKSVNTHNSWPMGKSKYKGVSQFKGKWQAVVWKDNEYTYCGRYDTEIEAALAYDKKAKELYGEFASLNL